MFRRAAEEFDVDFQRSYVVGDKSADIEAGRAVGAHSILVLTGYGPSSLEECRAAGFSPDAVRPSVVEAVTYILQQSEGDVRNHE